VDVLGALYHWSPASRRVEIMRQGLRPFSKATASSELLWPYICLSPTPAAAWGLSGDMEWLSEIEEWDLWMVRLESTDEVHVKANFGPVIKEVRVRNALPADRLWYVATRSPLSALDEDGKPATGPV
jgi:hypothetical protein